MTTLEQTLRRLGFRRSRRAGRWEDGRGGAALVEADRWNCPGDPRPLYWVTLSFPCGSCGGSFCLPGGEAWAAATAGAIKAEVKGHRTACAPPGAPGEGS